MKLFFVCQFRPVCALFLYFFFSVCVQAEEIISYDKIASDTFWRKLYPAGGWSLFCGYKFIANRSTAAGHTISIEHIYPTDLMSKQAGCQNRMQCRESHNARFTRMEADLHNMYPVSQVVMTLRFGFRYGLISGEDRRFDDCDIEWKSGVVEPRPIARGNIARAMLYMHSRYNIPVDEKSLILFRIWNKLDPPSKQEKLRNNIIERIQGNRNPYIDRPALAEQQKLTMLK